MTEEVKVEEVKEEVKVVEEVKAEADKANEKVSHSTKETKEALRLVFAFVKLIKEAKENDGVFSASDLMLLTKMFPYVGPAFDDANKILAELKDLDAKEIKDLLVFSGAQLSGVVSADEELVQKALEAAIALVELVAHIVVKK